MATRGFAISILGYRNIIQATLDFTNCPHLYPQLTHYLSIYQTADPVTIFNLKDWAAVRKIPCSIRIRGFGLTSLVLRLLYALYLIIGGGVTPKSRNKESPLFVVKEIRFSTMPLLTIKLRRNGQDNIAFCPEFGAVGMGETNTKAIDNLFESIKEKASEAPHDPFNKLILCNLQTIKEMSYEPDR